MGGNTSCPNECTNNGTERTHSSQDYKYLLGDLEKLTPVAQKIFSLGKGCLNSVEFCSQQKHFQKLDEHFNVTADHRHVSHIIQSENPQLYSQDEVSHDQPGHLQDKESSSHNDVIQDGESSSELSLFQAFKQTAPLYLSQTFVKWRTVYDFQKLVAVCAPKRTIIYIQPLDDFPEFISNFEFSFKQLRTDLFGLLQGFSQIFFMGLDVSVNPMCSTQQLGWSSLIKTRVHSVTGQMQQRATDFHPLLQRILPSDGVCVVGITWTDLYPEDDLNFVFGEASFQHKSGIFCFGRFEPKAFDKESHQDISEVDGLLVWKLIKVISHEMCHIFGLEHCSFFECLMNESTAMVDMLQQPLFLCPVCLRKLQMLCKFDVLERYSNLLVFLQELHRQLPSEFSASAIYWLQRCVRYLNSEQEMP